MKLLSFPFLGIHLFSKQRLESFGSNKLGSLIFPVYIKLPQISLVDQIEEAVLQKFMKNSGKINYRDLSRVKLKRLSKTVVPQTVCWVILKIKHQVLVGSLVCLNVLFISENGCLYSNLDTRLFWGHRKVGDIT